VSSFLFDQFSLHEELVGHTQEDRWKRRIQSRLLCLPMPRNNAPMSRPARGPTHGDSAGRRGQNETPPKRTCDDRDPVEPIVPEDAPARLHRPSSLAQGCATGRILPILRPQGPGLGARRLYLVTDALHCRVGERLAPSIQVLQTTLAFSCSNALSKEQPLEGAAEGSFDEVQHGSQSKNGTIRPQQDLGPTWRDYCIAPGLLSATKRECRRWPSGVPCA